MYWNKWNFWNQQHVAIEFRLILFDYNTYCVSIWFSRICSIYLPNFGLESSHYLLINFVFPPILFLTKSQAKLHDIIATAKDEDKDAVKITEIEDILSGRGFEPHRFRAAARVIAMTERAKNYQGQVTSKACCIQ